MTPNIVIIFHFFLLWSINIDSLMKSDRKKFINFDTNHKCAPSRLDYDGNLIDDYTCYSFTSLKDIAKSLNKKYDKVVINYDEYQRKDKRRLYDKIKYFMNEFCKDEEDICWVKQPFISHSQYTHEHTFKPMRSKLKYDWLSNIDIDTVMFQTQKYTIMNDKLDNFYYLGTKSIDFQSYSSPNDYNIKRIYKEGFRNIGCVLNLSKRSEPGTHWVTFMIHINDLKKEIQFMYFNSSGKNPPEEVVRYKDNVFKQMSYLKYKNIYLINKIKTQYGNSECGVYCLNFCVNIVMGQSFYDTICTTIDDETMNGYRNKFFRNVDKYNISKFHIPGHEI